MNIFIIHHHLHPGGVTKVIGTQCKALKEKGHKVELLLGEAPGTPVADVPISICPEINYFDDTLSPDNYPSILTKIRSFFDHHLSRGPCILHIHNLNLGKNPLLNKVFCDLAKEGTPLFNHCHDFAEDNRPANMERLHKVLGLSGKDLDALLYPAVPSTMYGIINSKDRTHLHHKGVSDQSILSIPNAIDPPEEQRNPLECATRVRQQLGFDDTLPLILYPVRVIRRKNIGEFILLATLFKDTARWLVTQPPKNPTELVEYEKWVDFCTTQNLKVAFAVGQIADFDDLMFSAQAIVTTSTMEGFGLSFLEPWLYGKPVIGRDIPDITKDFESFSIDLSALYSNLMVQGPSGEVDFALLSAEQQMSLITQANNSPEIKESIITKNNLGQLLHPVSKEIIQNNANAIISNYSLTSYATNLSDFYEKSF